MWVDQFSTLSVFRLNEARQFDPNHPEIPPISISPGQYCGLVDQSGLSWIGTNGLGLMKVNACGQGVSATCFLGEVFILILSWIGKAISSRLTMPTCPCFRPDSLILPTHLFGMPCKDYTRRRGNCRIGRAFTGSPAFILHQTGSSCKNQNREGG